MNQMETALTSAQTRVKPSSAKQPPVRLTAADVRARRLARLASNASSQTVIDESIVTDFVEISDELRSHERELAPLTKKGSTIPVDQLNSARASIESKVRECREELEALSGEFPGIVTVAARREELRASARNVIRTIGSLDPANSDGSAVRDLLTTAVGNGTLKSDGDSYVATVEDPVLQELEGRVEDFLAAVKSAREEEQRERADNVQNYLLGDRPVIQNGSTLPSPLQAEKSRPGRVSLTKLRAGDGERSFVPVFGTNASSGEEYFMGEVLIERQANKLVATKTSRVRLCEILFFAFDRAKSELRERGVLALPSDLERVQPNLFREALQRQLAKEVEQADRREKAERLSAVGMFNDAVSFADLRTGEKGRWVVNAEWMIAGRQRGSRVTFHVESDGKNFHTADAACNLEEVDNNFFGMYTKPTPLSALSSDKRWLAMAALNREFEIGWQLQRAVSQHEGDVTFITKENVADALGLEGIDGVYASSGRWKQQETRGSDAPRYVAIGFIVERRGKKVAIIFATPGTAEGLVEKEQGSYPLSDLPVMTRAVLRSVWMAATRDFGTVPEHLKAVATTKAVATVVE